MSTIEYRNASYRPGSYGSGKLVRQVEASLGDIRRTAATKPEAKAAVLAAVEEQTQHLYERRYLAADGVVFALYYADGWSYDIIRDGQRGCTTNFEASDVTEAFEKMRHHFEQYTEAVTA
jgi:hypothetical protein